MRLAACLWVVLLACSSSYARAQTETERFDIERFAVQGNTLLSSQEIEDLVRPFTGPKREYGDVQRALEALELRYRERGFSAVRVFVPEQELGKGVVRISVIEASVRRIRVQGARFFDEANIRRSLPAIRQGGFPNAAAISQNVQLANENPSKQLDVILKGTEQEGLIDIDVNVADVNPLKFSLTPTAAKWCCGRNRSSRSRPTNSTSKSPQPTTSW